jgi:hypothetical protein
MQPAVSVDFIELRDMMFEQRQFPRRRLALALAGFFFTVNAHADDAERIAALEARIARLESMLSAQTALVAPALTPTPTLTPAITTTSAVVLPNAAVGTKLMFSGFVKTDVLYTRTRDGELADGGIARDLYVPGLTPVGGASEGSDLDLHAKFSRLIFGTDGSSDSGALIQTRFEGDFFGNGLGDERFNNASGFVVRHAYLNYDNRWLVGQHWTTLMDAANLPESTDLVGPTEGTVFVRQPQLRYTIGNWMFAAENPETTLTPSNGNVRISSDDNAVPDLIARYNFKSAAGSNVSIGAIVRELKYQSTGSSAVSARSLGGGLTVTGKIPFRYDDVRFGLTGGRGLGRYLGLNLVNDAVLTSQNELDLIGGIYGYVGWQHLFNPKLRSNVFYAHAKLDNPRLIGLAGSSQTRASHSLHANIFYTPTAKLDIGTEIIFAERELESGAAGDLIRLHASVKYSF